MCASFLGEDSGEISRACFGVAGPVKDGRVQVTNLPWIVDAAALQVELKFKQVSLLNDLEANAYGINTLEAGELLPLNPNGDKQAVGNRALISAGTGLGEAGPDLGRRRGTGLSPARAATPASRRMTRSATSCSAISARSTAM